MIFEMLTVFNILAHGFGTAAAQVFPDKIVLMEKAPTVDEQKVVKYSAHESSVFSKGCQYEGVAVPYSRTWPQPIGNGDNTQEFQPPTPEKLEGFIIIYNKKICKGNEPENIMYFYQFHAKPSKDKVMITAAPGPIFDMLKITPKMRPLWFSQIMERLENVSRNDTVATDFFASIGSQRDALKTADEEAGISAKPLVSEQPVSTETTVQK